jgi:hypothetical protein
VDDQKDRGREPVECTEKMRYERSGHGRIPVGGFSRVFVMSKGQGTASSNCEREIFAIIVGHRDQVTLHHGGRESTDVARSEDHYIVFLKLGQRGLEIAWL